MAQIPPFDPTGATPCAADAHPLPATRVLSEQPFLYLGTPLTAAAFAQYVQGYDFGSIPPDYVVLHHTAVPSASWARYPSGAVWDDHETGLSPAQIQAKRRQQLDTVRNYYRDTYGWDRGPHLWIDEKWIWLFTPMREIGIHAKQGNAYHDGDGRLHYSIGIEVVGYYEHTPWPDPIARNVAAAVRALKDKLGTFQYVPGPWKGKISRHADYNKPTCPGAAIVPGSYIPILAGYQAPEADPLKTNLIAGADRAYFCGSGFWQFYTTQGGLRLFGYPRADERRATDAQGQACTVMPFERAVFKYKEGAGVHLALLGEARERGWLL